MEFIILMAFIFGVIIGVLSEWAYRFIAKRGDEDTMYMAVQEHVRQSQENSKLYKEIDILQRQILILADELSKYIKDAIIIHKTVREARVKAMKLNTLKGE